MGREMYLLDDFFVLVKGPEEGKKEKGGRAAISFFYLFLGGKGRKLRGPLERGGERVVFRIYYILFSTRCEGR